MYHIDMKRLFIVYLENGLIFFTKSKSLFSAKDKAEKIAVNYSTVVISIIEIKEKEK